jgi:hypothetical protein
MVTRVWLLLAGLASWGCHAAEASHEAESEALVLRGFHWVDAESRTLREGQLVIEHGVVVPRVTLSRQRVLEGGGQYLMPALWDLKASLWGNDSARDWEELVQELSFTRSLQVQLYFGVGHVMPFGMGGFWVERELKRADALQVQAAESHYPDKLICGTESFACDGVKTRAQAEAAVERRARRPVPIIELSFTPPAKDPTKDPMPALTPELLQVVLSDAKSRNLPTFVVVDDWVRAAQAVELGASVIYGFPAGPVPSELVAQMQARGVAFAPALTGYLELDRLLGHADALRDPLLTRTVRPDVLRTFESEQSLWSEFRPDLLLARQRRDDMLQSVARLARAGVNMIATSDAGWAPGTSQGYSSHALQNWFERAGLDGWTRLAAATVAPAALLGRHVGFATGDAADFVALEKNPVEHAENTRQISWVMRRGQLVDRERLLPDLTRGDYTR